MEDHPSLEVVKPDRKKAIKDILFEKCLTLTNNNLEVHNVMSGVFYIDNVLSQEECDSMILLLESNNSLNFWCNNPSEETMMFRNADTLEVEGCELSKKLWDRVKDLISKQIPEINVSDDESDPEYERELVGLWKPVAVNHDLLYARYPSYGSFAPHTDGRAIHNFNNRSFYSIILYLNTNELCDGGGTKFYKDVATKQLVKEVRGVKEEEYWTADASLVTAEVQAVQGRMLIFHQSLVHEGVPPKLPNKKYIIRSDVIFQRCPAICDSEVDRAAYQLYREAEDMAEAGNVAEATPLFRKALKMSPEMARIMGQ